MDLVDVRLRRGRLYAENGAEGCRPIREDAAADGSEANTVPGRSARQPRHCRPMAAAAARFMTLESNYQMLQVAQTVDGTVSTLVCIDSASGRDCGVQRQGRTASAGNPAVVMYVTSRLMVHVVRCSAHFSYSSDSHYGTVFTPLAHRLFTPCTAITSNRTQLTFAAPVLCLACTTSQHSSACLQSSTHAACDNPLDPLRPTRY